MALFMHYDPKVNSSPALGWFDTSLHPYKLPPSNELLEVTKAEWDRRWTEHLGVDVGRVVPVAPRSAL